MAYELVKGLIFGTVGNEVIEKGKEVYDENEQDIKEEITKHLKEYEESKSWRYGGIGVFVVGCYIFFDKEIRNLNGFSLVEIKKIKMKYPVVIMICGLGIYIVNNFLKWHKSFPLTFLFGGISILAFVWQYYKTFKPVTNSIIFGNSADSYLKGLTVTTWLLTLYELFNK